MQITNPITRGQPIRRAGGITSRAVQTTPPVQKPRVEYVSYDQFEPNNKRETGRGRICRGKSNKGQTLGKPTRSETLRREWAPVSWLLLEDPKRQPTPFDCLKVMEKHETSNRWKYTIIKRKRAITRNPPSWTIVIVIWES